MPMRPKNIAVNKNMKNKLPTIDAPSLEISRSKGNKTTIK
jgi:hypothetical protein